MVIAPLGVSVRSSMTYASAVSAVYVRPATMRGGGLAKTLAPEVSRTGVALITTVAEASEP